MVSKITQKSQNTLENQGNVFADQASGKEETLFDQFSDILDKIATSLNRAKKTSNDQNISDLSTSLSQAAAAHVAQRPQPVSTRQATEERVVREAEVAVKTKESSDKPAVTESATPVVNQAPADKEVAAKAAPKEGDKAVEADAESCDAPQQETVSDKEVADAVEVSADANGEIEVAPQAEVAVEAADGQAVTVAPEQSSQTEGETVEVAAEAVEVPVTQAATVAGETTQVQTQKLAVESEVAPAVSSAPVKAAEQTQVASEEVTVPATQAAVQTSSDVASAVQQDASASVNVKAQPVATEFLTNQQILAQSAQELIQQALLLSPMKPLIEVAALQKSFAMNSGTNAVTATGATQNVGASLTQQVKSSSQWSEKSSVRELSRGAASRTMERVESALKEVARSKDGKTISLRLDPPSLGSLKIDVTLKDGQLHARFVAESPQVTALLREQSHELQQILRKAGIDAEGISVSVASEQHADVASNFSSFDQQVFQQPERAPRASKGFGGTGEVGGESAGSAAPGRDLDHWIA